MINSVILGSGVGGGDVVDSGTVCPAVKMISVNEMVGDPVDTRRADGEIGFCA